MEGGRHGAGPELFAVPMLNSMQKKVYVFDESGSMDGFMEYGELDGEDHEPVKKIDAVKKMMKRYVTDRFRKYPNSQISVLGFGTETRVICEAGAQWKEVCAAVDDLKADFGTDILQAVEFAVQHIEDAPSKLKTNQIIFVSDGQDSSAHKVTKLIGKMKKLKRRCPRT